MCDNYQPAPEDRAERKGRMGGGGEVSRRRRERLKWEEDGHMKSLEKKSSFSLVSLVGTAFSLPFLGYLLCGVWGASSRYVSPTLPPASSSTRPPSLESVIRPSWRGVKNIMREGPPSKKEPGGTFSTCAIPSLTLSSALRPPQTSISPLPPLLCSSPA